MDYNYEIKKEMKPNERLATVKVFQRYLSTYKTEDTFSCFVQALQNLSDDHKQSALFEDMKSLRHKELMVTSKFYGMLTAKLWQYMTSCFSISDDLKQKFIARLDVKIQEQIIKTDKTLSQR